MFKRKSRSLSRDKEEGVLRKSLLSLTSNNEDDIQLLGQEQIQPPVMDNSGSNNYNNNSGLHPDMRSWDDNDPDQVYDPAYNFTQGHPVGAILFKVTADLTKLAEQVKLKDMSTNVNDLCRLFQNGTKMERTKTINSILMNNTELEEKILSKELQAHKLENDINCPPYFAAGPVLIDNPHKLNEVSKVFPRAQCFSGTHREGLMSVSEFLKQPDNCTNAMQHI